MRKQYIIQRTYNIHQLGSCGWLITLPCVCTCNRSDVARYQAYAGLNLVRYNQRYNIHQNLYICIYTICKAHDTKLTSLPGLSTIFPWRLPKNVSLEWNPIWALWLWEAYISTKVHSICIVLTAKHKSTWLLPYTPAGHADAHPCSNQHAVHTQH